MANYVHTLDGQAVTIKTFKDRKKLEEYQTLRKIKRGQVHIREIPVYERVSPLECRYKFNASVVLEGVEFEVELQEDHAFKVEAQGNVDAGVGL
ncbi:hypothetical protein Tco_1320737 [Tanacetum coccineum]